MENCQYSDKSEPVIQVWLPVTGFLPQTASSTLHPESGAPDVGFLLATDHTQVLLGRQVVVLLRFRPARRLEQQTHHEGVL